MNSQIIFIIDKKTNVLIFLGKLDDESSINQQELAKVLGSIVSQSSKLALNSQGNAEIEGKNYIFGHFDKLIITIQYKGEKPAPELLEETNKAFINMYSTILENYSESDIGKFKGFLTKAKEISRNIETKEKPSIVETQVTQKPPEPKPEMQPIPAPITEDDIGSIQLINPMKREAFPEGIPEYKIDEVLWNEGQMVKDEYSAEFVDGMISNLQIFLSISLTHHYEIVIDFSGYPQKPKINIGAGLQKELGKNMEELLYFYKNWDTKIPPHLIELVREIEAVLMKFKAKGKLADTDEMPESALPDLEPLPELPPWEEEPAEEPPKEPDESNEEPEEKKNGNQS